MLCVIIMQKANANVPFIQRVGSPQRVFDSLLISSVGNQIMKLASMDQVLCCMLKLLQRCVARIFSLVDPGKSVRGNGPVYILGLVNQRFCEAGLPGRSW